MMVGKTSAGKTTVIDTLKTAKTEEGIKTRVYCINPKDRPILEL